jgi:hypothetical protein
MSAATGRKIWDDTNLLDKSQGAFGRLVYPMGHGIMALQLADLAP